MVKTNYGLKLLTIILSVFLIGYFLEEFKVGPGLLRDYFLISTELLPLVLSFSIFVMIWFVYHRSKDNHSLFMGWAFFVIGLIDLYYFLSLPFMPDFITSNSPHKAEIFWIEARLISAILFLVSAYIYKDTLKWLTNKSVLFASVIVLSFMSLITGLHPEYIPVMTHLDGSPTMEKTLFLSIISLIILYAGYLYYARFQETGHKNLICLIYGFVLLASGYLVYLFYVYPGALLEAAGFYFSYLGLFRSSIEIPYENLARSGEKRVLEAEERYRNLFDNANDAIITTDLQDRVTSWNRSAERFFGWKAEEMLGNKFSPLAFDQKLQAENHQIVGNAISGGPVTGIEMLLECKDGAKIDVSMTISPLRDTNQNVNGLSGIFRDNTERRRAEEQMKASLREKEVLMREIHHRVKNNMQIISSLLRLQSSYIPEKKYKDMYNESQNRIATMSLIHEKLYQSNDLTKIDANEYITDLVNGLLKSYDVNTGQVEMNIDAKNVLLGINSAVPCGLIINELVSNSLKYAFPDGKKGEIKISLHPTAENNMELVVRDNGIGIPAEMDFRKTNSWGMRMVTILAENQLRGEINLERSKGTEFQIKFMDVK
ncbi:MAG: PAS domain S-box protein [Candidatus Methanoperedens sp.]|nr:PAS domain S-box protein [Candidatus Methanoperedens sp.]MCZ7371559.1 PAS domain S-box protein [Candidatus Methanoperedens sp.]